MSDEGALLRAVHDSVIVRPGDTLILIGSSARSLSDAELDKMSAMFAERMPGMKVAVVDGFEQALAYRPDAEGYRCGHVMDSLIANVLPLMCTKPAGHQYAHGDDSGCQWTEGRPDTEAAA